MFIIECIPKFTENVLPKLFKHCKFASFVRQLNIYGFQRDTDARKSKDSKDKETCRWYHPYFRPGRRDLFYLIRRKTPRYSRRKRVKAAEDVETIINVESGDESGTEVDYGSHANEISGNEGGSRRSPSSDRLSGTALQPSGLEFESQVEGTQLFRQGSCPELISQDTRSLSAPHSVPDTDINIGSDSMMLLQYTPAQHKPASLTFRELQLCKQVIYQKRTYEAMQHAFTTQMQETHSKLEAQQAQIDDLCAAIQSMDQSQEQIIKQNTICGTTNPTIGTSSTAYVGQPTTDDCTMTSTDTVTAATVTASTANSHYPQSVKIGYLPKHHSENMKHESTIQSRPSHITLTEPVPLSSYDVYTPLSDFTPFQTMADSPFGGQANSVHFRSQASGSTIVPAKQNSSSPSPPSPPPYQHQASWPIQSTQCVVSNASRIATAAAMTAAATTNSNISTKLEVSMTPNIHTNCL
ncbi:HSF-type DNA-binding-domain-containing protein [Phycomyces blakesleeanus]